jgi:hypothetical protein
MYPAHQFPPRDDSCDGHVELPAWRRDLFGSYFPWIPVPELLPSQGFPPLIAF